MGVQLTSALPWMKKQKDEGEEMSSSSTKGEGIRRRERTRISTPKASLRELIRTRGVLPAIRTQHQRESIDFKG